MLMFVLFETVSLVGCCWLSFCMFDHVRSFRPAGRQAGEQEGKADRIRRRRAARARAQRMRGQFVKRENELRAVLTALEQEEAKAAVKVAAEVAASAAREALNKCTVRFE